MSIPGFLVLAEALEATNLNVEVEDPKLYHGNCVDVIANKVADGSVDLVLNDPPRSWKGLTLNPFMIFSDPLYDWFSEARVLQTEDASME